MRGTVQSYDPDTGQGVIRTDDGSQYPFSRSRLLRRSKPPRPEATIVFRLKNGKVHKATVVSYNKQWEWLAHVGEALLYLPLALTE